MSTSVNEETFSKARGPLEKCQADEITPAMTGAGLDCIAGFDPRDDDCEQMVNSIYRAMEAERLRGTFIATKAGNGGGNGARSPAKSTNVSQKFRVTPKKSSRGSRGGGFCPGSILS